MFRVLSGGSIRSRTCAAAGGSSGSITSKYRSSAGACGTSETGIRSSPGTTRIDERGWRDRVVRRLGYAGSESYRGGLDVRIWIFDGPVDAKQREPELVHPAFIPYLRDREAGGRQRHDWRECLRAGRVLG